MTTLAERQVSAPDDFTFVQGEFQITVVSDGYITVPIDIVAPEGSPEERQDILMKTGDPSAGLVESKTNIPIIRKGDDLIIVDIGSGDKYQRSDGRLTATTCRQHCTNSPKARNAISARSRIESSCWCLAEIS